MKIIRATEEELSLVIDMKMKMFDEVGTLSLLKENVDDLILEKYRSLYREDKCCHFILYDNETPIAIAGAVIKEDIPFCFFKTPFYGYIIDVYCIPKERKKGYATQVVTSVMNWLEEKGVNNIKLKPSNEARSMYEHLGFQESGEMEKWIK